MPSHTRLLPFREPIQFSTWLHEELHFHLLELTHTENELASHDFITESLSNLSDTERNLHTTRLLHVQIVYENTLCRFGTQIHFHRRIGRSTHLRREHQVELANIRPVFRSADGVNDFLIKNDLLQHFKVWTLHSLSKTSVQSIAFSLCLCNARRCFQIFSLVERIAKTLASFLYFLLNLFVVLGNLLFNQHVSTITLLGIAVVDEWIVESVHVSRCLPNRWVHENGGVNTHDILVKQYHALPPILFNVVFQFNAVLSVVVNGSQSIVNLTAWENKTIFFTMAYNLLKNVFLCHKMIKFRNSDAKLLYFFRIRVPYLFNICQYLSFVHPIGAYACFS